MAIDPVARGESAAEHTTELEARVEERTRQLKEANQELEDFVFTVSHDLRAPLRHMEGFVGLLVRHLEARPEGLDEKGRHYLERITGASQAMGALLADLLILSRVARQEMIPSTVDLDGMLASLVKEYPAGPAWELGALGKVKGDLYLLQQTFRNLLSNAAKFSAPMPEPRAWVRRSGTCHGKPIFEVGDNGVGFDPAFADKLFGVFQRLHPREDFEGTGIGLAIVAQAVRRHGGEVWATSTPGQGARFFLTLEAAEEVV